MLLFQCLQNSAHRAKIVEYKELMNERITTYKKETANNRENVPFMAHWKLQRALNELTLLDFIRNNEMILHTQNELKLSDNLDENEEFVKQC